ncbi:MAG: hypothetical protein IH586_17110 [Anaerolineaceae bacterium]|nr:hypothetical protein [Anaerolineaceae bacterium]
MPNQPAFDIEAAHRFFSADCFNKAWDLIEKKDRSAAEEEDMLRLSMASTWHWTQRTDCTPANLSVGYWQTARIYSLLKQFDHARRYAQLCLDTAQNNSAGPFYIAYGYEALARVESLVGEPGKKQIYLDEAHRLAEEITNAEDRGVLEGDLKTIR